MINLDMNENQYGPAPECYEVLKNATLEMLNSYAREKPFPLVRRLSDLYGIPTEKILLGNGSEELLKLAFQIFGSNGQKVMLPYEGWSYFKKICREVNSKMIEYPVDELEDRFHYNMDKIFPMYQEEKPDLFMACCPNNPTGNSFTIHELEMFLKESPKTVVIWDQAYYGFTEEDMDEEVRRLVYNYPNLLVLRTFSKYYALAGIRIGYGFVGENMGILHVYNNRYLGFNNLTQAIAEAALDSKEYYEEIAQKQIKDRDQYFEVLSAIDGVKPFRSEATYFIARIELKKLKILKKGLEERGIKIKFIKDVEFPNFIRISLGTEEQNKKVMDAFKELIG